MLQFDIFIKKSMDYNLLSGSPLFRGLATYEIEEILSKIPNRIRKFASGTLVVQSGEPVNELLVVLKGVVKGEMIDFAGRIIKIEDITAPGALAPAFMFGNKNRFPVNVITISETELLVICKEDFLTLLTKDNRILVNFLNMISNRSQFLSEKIKFLNFKTIKGKLAHYILQKAVQDNQSLRLELTQSELADFFGVARPSVARALGELEEDGLILAKGKNIKILDKRGLSSLESL